MTKLATTLKLKKLLTNMVTVHLKDVVITKLNVGILTINYKKYIQCIYNTQYLIMGFAFLDLYLKLGNYMVNLFRYIKYLKF